MLAYIPTRPPRSDFHRAQLKLKFHLVKEAPPFKQGNVLGRNPIDLTTREATVLNIAQALLLWPYLVAYDPSDHQEIPRFLENMRADMQAARAKIDKLPEGQRTRLTHLWNVATRERHITEISTTTGKREDKQKKEAAIMLAFELALLMRY